MRNLDMSYSELLIFAVSPGAGCGARLAHGPDRPLFSLGRPALDVTRYSGACHAAPRRAGADQGGVSGRDALIRNSVNLARDVKYRLRQYASVRRARSGA